MEHPEVKNMTFWTAPFFSIKFGKCFELIFAHSEIKWKNKHIISDCMPDYCGNGNTEIVCSFTLLLIKTTDY